MKNLFLTIIFSLCFTLNIFGDNTENFIIHKGLNISHWLSQRPNNQLPVKKKQITEKDFKLISDLGFDHVRIPIDEMILWDESGNKIKNSFNILHHGIKWALKHHLRVVVDLHILRSHHFNAGVEGGTNTLWTDRKEQEHFLNLWEMLSEELKDYDNSMVAYEIMNEPIAPDHEDWNKLLQKAYDKIRSLEKKRILIIGSNMWQGVGTFPYLKVPANDPNILLSCHFYEPFLLSHYKAEWTALKDISKPIHYPGTLIAKEDYASMSENERSKVQPWSGNWNRATLSELLSKAKKRADELGLNLYCGEFGIYSKTPRKEAYHWYNDITDVFNELNIAWCKWDYKGGFSIFTKEGIIDKKLLKMLKVQ